MEDIKIVDVPFSTAIGYFPEIIELEKQGYIIIDKFRDPMKRVNRCYLKKFKTEKKDGKV